jgi:hypothetical protein
MAKLDKQSLIDLFNERVNTFSEDELNEITSFFSNVFSDNFISSKEEALDILLEQGLPKALSKLSKEKQMEMKKKFLSL